MSAVLGVIALAMVIYVMMSHAPRLLAFVLGILLLLAANQKADAATLYLSVIAEPNVIADDVVRDAAAIYQDQLGIDLQVTYSETATVSAHTHVEFLLDDVVAYRRGNVQHRAADVTVLFTRRDIRMGTSDYVGYATTGPACSANASAVVQLTGTDDSVTLAHEIAHTLGVMHDETPGWLMSSLYAGPTFSPDSVLTIRASGFEQCRSPAAASDPEVAKPQGGGGAMDGPLFFVLLVLLAVWRHARKLAAERDAQRRAIKGAIARVLHATGAGSPHNLPNPAKYAK